MNERDDSLCKRAAPVSIPIVNVGLGAARNLRIFWKFPIDHVVSSVNRLAHESLVPVFFEYENGILHRKSKYDAYVLWHGAVDIDFVLPASIQQAPTQLDLPLAYTTLGAALQYFAFKKASETRDSDRDASIPEVPPLECRLEYTDIGGINHRIDLFIHMDIAMISRESLKCYFYSSRRDA